MSLGFLIGAIVWLIFQQLVIDRPLRRLLEHLFGVRFVERPGGGRSRLSIEPPEANGCLVLLIYVGASTAIYVVGIVLILVLIEKL